LRAEARPAQASAAMAARLFDQRTYAAPAHTVFELLTDPRFQEERSRHLGTIRVECRRREEGDLIVMELDETRDTGFANQAFRSLHVTRWKPDSIAGVWELRQTEGIGNASARGTIAIERIDDACCRLTVEGTLEIAVRRWGRMIERIASSALRLARGKEARFIAARLAQR
jgi:hypothetical protein